MDTGGTERGLARTQEGKKRQELGRHGTRRSRDWCGPSEGDSRSVQHSLDLQIPLAIPPSQTSKCKCHIQLKH